VLARAATSIHHLAVSLALAATLLGSARPARADDKKLRLVTQSYEVLLSLEGLLVSLGDVGRSQQDFLLSGDAPHLAVYQAATARLSQQLKSLKELVDTPARSEQLSRLEALVAQMLAEAKRTIGLRREKGPEAARAALRAGPGTKEIRKLVAQMKQAEADRLRQRKAAPEEKPPAIPDRLKVPGDNKLLFSLEAEGVQVYVSRAGKGGKPEWAFKAPLAGLSAKGKPAGYHYGGPTWEARDGSRLTRDDAEQVASAAAPDPKRDIAWLRIKVRADGKKGSTFGAVGYVQRVNTRGGLPPAEPPVRVGTEVGVRYTATYVFSRAGQ
jgi:CHASE3 domain sensor protein